MKTLFFYLFTFISIIIFTQCEDNLTVREEGEEVPEFSAKIQNTDKGVEYLGQRFYLNSTDNNSTFTTRSTDSGGLLYRTFTVSASEGESFLGVHIMPANIVKDGKEQLQEVFVSVNGEEAGTLELTKDEWEFATLKGKKAVFLKDGENIITFASEPPFYPEIDAIQIEASLSQLITTDPQYDAFVSHLKKSNYSLSLQKVEQEELEKEIARFENPQIKTRSAINPGDWNWQVTPVTWSNPDGNYAHKMNVPITYTYHRKLSLSTGNYVFHTTTAEGETNSVDPVMYLYNINYPHDISFVNDDGGDGLHSRLAINNLPAGDYYLVVRAYSSSYSSTPTGRQGLINVYQNGVKINSNSPLAGYMVDVDTPYTGTMNFFTAYSTGIPEFYLEEKGSNLLKWFGETMFYASPMDHMWWDDARCRIIKRSTARYRMLITSVGAFGAYYGNCDVYGMVPNAISGDGYNVLESFPNLKQNDAMYSGIRGTNIYNCASWAGGITSGWMWGGIYASQTDPTLVGPYYGSPSVWDTWDKFFGNNPSRYAGATTYTRTDANSSNGEIAVWSTNGNISGVTHFSVTGTANKHPHGYAWESKPGALIRTLHPRDALNGSAYGQIIAYYRDASKDPYQSVAMTRSLISENNLTFKESLEKGLTVIEKVELNEHLASQFNAKKQVMTKNINDAIQNLYNKWVEKCNSIEMAIHSNPYIYIETQEGLNLLKYCLNNKEEALLFFMDLYFNNEKNDVPKEISYYIFCSVFKDNAEVMEQIKSDWNNNPYNEKSAYIAPMPETFTKKFAVELFEKNLKGLKL